MFIDIFATDKKYQVIYADPPWPQRKGGLRKVRPNQRRILDYSVLELDDIAIILRECPVATNHTVFVWAIDKFLHETEAMFHGYKLHARLVWDKGNGVAPAFTVRYTHEYLLWFYRGDFTPVASEVRGKYATVLRERSTKHSRKPECAYQMIENLYPNLTKLELFARSEREGWDCWGDEVGGVE